MNYNYLEYPSEKEKNLILDDNEKLKELSLDLDLKENNKLNFFDDFKYYTNLKEWLRQFNTNKLEQLRITYINLINYYNKIPEGKNYNNWEDKHFHYKFMFEYYFNIFYYIFFSSIDCVCQLVNICYKLEINEDKKRFGEEVAKRLKKQNNNKLAKFLIQKYNSDVMKTGRHFRNNLTHNYPPTRSRRVINEEKNKFGKWTEITGIYKEEVPKEFIVDNICGLIAVLVDIVKRLERDLNNK